MRILLILFFASSVCFGQMKAPICEGDFCKAPMCESVEGLEVETEEDIPYGYTGLVYYCPKLSEDEVREGKHKQRTVSALAKYSNGLKTNTYSYGGRNLRREIVYADSVKRVTIEYEDLRQLKKYTFNLNGRPEGEFIQYWKTGFLRSKGQFVDGRPEGEWFFYSKDGILIGTGNYKRGRIESCKGDCGN